MTLNNDFLFVLGSKSIKEFVNSIKLVVIIHKYKLWFYITKKEYRQRG